MRIGLIAGPWIPIPPPTYGGIERVVDTLARGFTDAGHEVLLAASEDSECPVPMVAGMRPAEPADMGCTLSEMSHVVKSYEAMREVDIIHDHTLAGPLYAHRPKSVPVVTTIHGPLIPQMVDVYTAIERNTGIIGISHDQLSHVPGLRSATVIHHGLDVSTVAVGSGKGGYACFVGRISPDKGVMEAITLARRAGVPLRIAAKMRDPEEKRYFREVVEPVLGSNEEFLGELGDNEKYQLMGEAFVFLNPIQWSEPFGLVMIEAMATGTPVVSTPIGSAPEIVDHGTTGFLGSLEELAALVPTAAGLSREACRAAVEERFSARRMVVDHLRLYSQILEEQASGELTVGDGLEEEEGRATLARGV